MMIFVIIIHVIVCIGLIGLVLIQRGRGGGLVESFAGVESMFGTKTDKLLTRLTTILSILFFLTCLLLAVLSIRQSKSLIKLKKAAQQTEATVPAEPPKEAAGGAAVSVPETENPPASVETLPLQQQAAQVAEEAVPAEK